MLLVSVLFPRLRVGLAVPGDLGATEGQAERVEHGAGTTQRDTNVQRDERWVFLQTSHGKALHLAGCSFSLELKDEICETTRTSSCDKNLSSSFLLFLTK
uniref:Putative secreted protein n=1 Tax=Anopheles darlingi TaxID=43151 RepID=A0A2M4DJS2_ANODA